MGTSGLPEAGQSDSEQHISVLSLIHRSKEKVSENRLDEALEQIRAAIALDPAYAGVWKQQGRVLMLKKDYPGAIASLKMSLELKSDDKETHGWIIRSFLAEERLSEAAAYLDSLPEKVVSNIDSEIISEVLMKAVEKADVVNGERIAGRWGSRSSNPGSRAATSAIKRLIEGNLGDARKILEGVPTVKGSERLLASAWSLLGKGFMEAGQIDKAIEAQKRALEIEADFLPALRELGWAYRRAWKPKEAADTWEKGLRREPSQRAWLTWISEARFETGQIKEAEAAADRVLKAEPGSSLGRTMKLASLLLQNKDDEALSYEKRLMKAASGKRIISIARFYADIYRGRFKEAAERLENELRLSPEDVEIRALLAGTYARWAATLKGRDAAGPLRKLVALTPDNAGAWRDLGWSLWEKKQQNEAIDAWDRAVKSGVRDRKRVIVQVVAFLAEQGYGVQAKDLYKRWEPEASPLALGVTLTGQRRLVAAREILTAAWETRENPAVNGLYLSYAEALTGECSRVPVHIAPFLERDISLAGSSDMDIFFAAIEACSSEAELLPVIMRLEADRGRFPKSGDRITGILQAAAERSLNANDHETGLNLYTLVLKHDADRPGVWLRAFNAAKNLGRSQDAVSLLKDALARCSSESVAEGIRGRLADEKGEIGAAVIHYRKSLVADPNQPDLRLLLFADLLSLRRFKEARDETEWFVIRVESGDEEVRSHLAEMHSGLGEVSKALDLWQRLYLTRPDTQQYALEVARALYLLCRAEEAVPILEKLLENKPYVPAYELLAEIKLALNRPAEAVEWTTRGLSERPSNNLLRLRAEAAEMAGNSELALQSAEAVLKNDPGDTLMVRIAGRALLDPKIKKQDRAKEYYEALLKRNGSYHAGLKSLREINSSRQATGLALKYADEIVSQRPWDTHAVLDQALSRAEDDQFRQALQFLRSTEKFDAWEAIPLLIYDGVTYCPYPGRTNASQVSLHLERLVSAGYTLITPDMIGGKRNKAQAVVVVADADEASLKQIDAVLRRIGGKAVYACKSDSLLTHTPGSPAPEMIFRLRDSGHWMIASSGQGTAGRVKIDDSGRLGNHLTHRITTADGKEDSAGMAARLDRVMTESADALGPLQTRIFLYPSGDYGHLSLDAEAQDLETLRSQIAKHFRFAVAADDNGFVGPGFDPLRLPGYVVAPGLSADGLMNHLTRRNPFVRSKLELGKVYFLNSQNERAEVWLRRADALGADPEEVNFYRGSNAYGEGDVPLSLQTLRVATNLNPDSLRNRSALERSENSGRPMLDLSYRRWTDSDRREYSSEGGSLQAYLKDSLLLKVFGERARWSREGLGSEDGTRFGGGLQWFFAPEHWLDVKLWNLHYDHVDDHIGGLVNVHLPNAAMGGHVDLQAAREEIDTVEAVREKILADRFALQTYSRLFDTWDLYADLTYLHMSDDNQTIQLDGIFMKRLHEWPFLGIGYKFSLADSKRNPPQYWAPRGLQLHQLYATTRGLYGRLHYSVSGMAGFADETDSQWKFVWGARLDLDFKIAKRWSLFGRYTHQETPIYNSQSWSFGTKFIF